MLIHKTQSPLAVRDKTAAHFLYTAAVEQKIWQCMSLTVRRSSKNISFEHNEIIVATIVKLRALTCVTNQEINISLKYHSK